MAKDLFSRLAMSLRRRRPASDSGGGEPGGALPSPGYARVFARAEAALREVELPGHDIDIVSAGLVRRLRLSRDGRRIIVFVDYKLSDPGCSFCRFISDTLWARIVERIVEALEAEGFSEVLVVDSVTGALLNPGGRS